MTDMTISELVTSHVNKDYYLPSIQRLFVWGRKERKIEKLFDSILQGYPIGHLLVWTISKDVGVNTMNWETYKFIDNYKEFLPQNEEANLNGISIIHLVLDGQQRITAFLIGLKGTYSYKSRNHEKRTKLYIDLFTNMEESIDNPESFKYKFKFAAEKPGDSCWFEIGKVLDYSLPKTSEDFKSSMKEEVEKHPSASPEKVKFAMETLGHIHYSICTNKLIHVEDFSNPDENMVLNIFVRTNDGGTPLEKSDLLLSFMEADRTVFQPNGARKEVQSFVARLNEESPDKRNYNFKKDDILKAALVLSDLEVQYKLKNFNATNLKILSDNWFDVKKYMELTVKLITKYGYSSKSITSKNALIPIAYYLKREKKNEAFIHSDKTADVKIREDIIYWLNVSMMKNAFGGSSDTTLTEIRKALKGTSVTLETLIKGEEIIEDTIIEWIEKEKYQSKFSHLILMLITDRKHWDQCHQDHIYPKSKFTKEQLKNNYSLSDDKITLYIQKVNSIANLQLLNPSVNISKHADDFIDWNDGNNPSYRELMLIPDGIDYTFTNFLKFTEERNKLIISKLSDIFRVTPVTSFREDVELDSEIDMGEE
jgi:uncharacterized protein with ParB-like and HNH nuclease domain